MSEQVLTDFEIVQILNTDRPKTGWAYGLCREVEAKVVSRCRAQGGNTSDNITQSAANKVAEEGGLSDEQINAIADQVGMGTYSYECDPRAYGLRFARSIIAADRASQSVGLPTDNEEISIGSREFFDLLITLEQEPCVGNRLTIADFVDKHIDKLLIDRASRQVANKAEVEPSDSYKAGYADGMDEGAKLAFWGDKPSEKFPEGWPSEIWLNAGDDELAPFSEYDELSWCSAPQGESDVRYIREDLLATPPATTGASTARDQALEDAAEAIDAMNDASGDAAAYDNREQNLFELEREHAISACAEKVRSLKGSVGASTLLTDERIATIDTPDFVSLLLAWETDKLGTSDRSKEFYALTAHIDRHVAREVAAQAGQVAVPGWISVDEQLPSSDLLPNGDCPSVIGLWKEGALASNLVQQMITNTAYLRNNPQNFTHWMPLPPSPAKESK